MQSAAKVGLLVIVFVGLLFGAYAAIGKTLFAPKMDKYFAVFQDASGVSATTPVLMAGVKIGNVKNVELSGPKSAKITFEVTEGTHLPIGSTAVIPTPLIGLGETPLSIVAPEHIDGSLPPGSTLVGTKSGALDNILPDSKQTVQEMNKTLVAVRKLLEDQQLKNHVDKLLATSEKTAADLDTLMKSANSVLLDNRQQISQALRTANVALLDVRRATNQVATLLEDHDLKGNLKGMVADMKSITHKTDALVDSMNDLVNDPKLRNALGQTATNVSQISDTGKEIAENTRQMTEQGVEISKNVNVISQKTIPLVDRATDVMTKAGQIEDQLQGAIEKVGGFLNRKAGPNPLANVGVTMDLMRQTNPGYWRTDVGFSVPLGDMTVYGGLYDAFGSNKLTLEIGRHAAPNLQYRYGIYAAKPAVGVDFQLARRLAIRSDVWDINKLRVDLRARYDFGNGIVGWAGIDSLFDRNAPTIGIGLRR